MKRNIILIISIVIILSFNNDVHAADTVYSLNKYKEEKYENIINSYNKDNKQDGFVVAGNVLKETITIDKEKYNDYQVALVKYDTNGKVKWLFTYGKTDIDNLDSLTYTYDEENKVNGYLLVMKQSNNINEQRNNNSIFVRVDLNGKLVEEVNTSLKENSIITKIISVNDQNNNIDSYIAIGYNEYPFIAKYDKNLNLIFEKEYQLNNTTFNDIAVIRNQKTVDSYALSITENNDKKINKVVKYNLEGNEVSTITTSEYENDKINFLEEDNGIIIYGITNEVKLSKEDSLSYYILNYNTNNEEVWETIGNTPVDENAIIRLINNQENYLIMYTNSNDKSNEIVNIDINGLVKEKVKKIKNDYYNITNFNTYNNTIYIIGQITCPEDEICDYDSNSLFLVSDQDKVIEVHEDDASSISIVTFLFVVAIILVVVVRKKKEQLNTKSKKKH